MCRIKKLKKRFRPNKRAVELMMMMMIIIIIIIIIITTESHRRKFEPFSS
jgi:hypothetical protein